MSQSAANEGADGADRVARDRAARQISDVLLNLEGVIAHATKAHKQVSADGVDTNRELALADAVKELQRLHKKLLQDTYFAVDTRLI